MPDRAIPWDMLWESTPNIPWLLQEGNIQRLIHLLGHQRFDVRWRAAEALGKVGERAVEPLISALSYQDVDVRLGAIEALGDIRDHRAVGPLLGVLTREKSEEVRWAAALSLGEIGDSAAVESLVRLLREPSKYLRFSGALALRRLHWIPPTTEQQIRWDIALQNWPAVQSQGAEATAVLIELLDDSDVAIRTRAVTILGEIGQPTEPLACDRALTDPNPLVRWAAFLSFRKCGLSIMHLTRGLQRRRIKSNNPLVAAFLNFLFLGMGYHYLGKWWGFLLFQVNLTAIVILSLLMGPVLPYLFSYTISAAFSIHAWRMARRMPELP